MDEERNEYHFWNEKTWKGTFLISSVMVNGQGSNMHFSDILQREERAIRELEFGEQLKCPLSSIIPASQPSIHLPK
jgi:hypothetical protein